MEKAASGMQGESVKTRRREIASAAAKARWAKARAAKEAGPVGRSKKRKSSGGGLEIP